MISSFMFAEIQSSQKIYILRVATVIVHIVQKFFIRKHKIRGGYIRNKGNDVKTALTTQRYTGPRMMAGQLTGRFQHR